jgi:hypothetical protein
MDVVWSEGSWDSIVGIVTVLRAGRSRDKIPAGARYFSLL